MKKLLPALLLACLSFVACKKNSFTLSGTLEGGENGTVWLEEMSPEGPLFIDSIHLDARGKFSYTYAMPYPSLYNLHISANNYVVLQPDYGEKISLTGNWSNLATSYSLAGSPESDLLWQLQQNTNQGAEQLRSLVDTASRYAELFRSGLISKEAANASKRTTDSIYRETLAEQHDFAASFVEENRGSLSTLIALYKTFNNRPLFDPRDSTGAYYYGLVLEGLEERQPSNPHTTHFRRVVEHQHLRTP